MLSSTASPSLATPSRSPSCCARSACRGSRWHLSFADFAGGKTRRPGLARGRQRDGRGAGARRRPRQEDHAVGRHPDDARGEQHGKLGGKDDDERLEVLRWLFFDNHKFTSYFATWRFMKSFAAKRARPGRRRVPARAGSTARSSSSRSTWPAASFMVGDAFSIADISPRATSSIRPRRAATSSRSASRTSPPGASA